jgi:hypothetical protein
MFGWIIHESENIDNQLFIKGRWSSNVSLELSDYHLYFLEFFFENIIQRQLPDANVLCSIIAIQYDWPTQMYNLSCFLGFKFYEEYAEEIIKSNPYTKLLSNK